MANKLIKVLTEEKYKRGTCNGFTVKRTIRLGNRMFKTTYDSHNGSTRNDHSAYMFTDANGWVFIANAIDIGFEPITYVSNEAEQISAAKAFFVKMDKYLVTLFGE